MSVGALGVPEHPLSANFLWETQLVQHARSLLHPTMDQPVTARRVYECMTAVTESFLAEGVLEGCLGAIDARIMLRMRTKLAGIHGIAQVNLEALTEGILGEADAFIRMGMNQDMYQRLHELTIGDILDQAPYLILGQLV